MSSPEIPDEIGNSVNLDAPASGEGSPSTATQDTTTLGEEMRDSNAVTSENELDPTSLDEDLLRYLFTIC